MSLAHLESLVSEKETETVEFKQTTAQRKLAAKTVCGMLNNASGGSVFFGVTDKGELKGQEATNKTLGELAAEFRQISPPAFPEIQTIPLHGKWKIILIRVPGHKGGLYTYDGRPYLRYGTTTQVMPREEYTRRLLEQVHDSHRWENELAPDWVKISDLDEEEVQITLKNATALGRMAPIKDASTTSILQGLGLIKDGHLLNAAIALYGKGEEFMPQFPQLSLRLARFRGVDRLADFLDSREYWGHAFSLLRRSEHFLLDHMPIAGRVVPGKMVREDYPMYPPRAFREAVANAICHRDYISGGGSVGIAMYDDYLEIINPGGFHFDITPAKLIIPHESKPWNPLVAQVFYRAGVIEKWRTGTLNILDWCKENGNPQPRWKERTESVVVTFYPSTTFEKQVRPESRPESERHSLVTQVIHIVSPEPLSASEIARKLGHKTISGGLRKVLRDLLEEGMIELTIPEKKASRLQKYRLSKKML